MGTNPTRILVFGGTGTAGRGAVRGLLAAGHEVRCFVRSGREGQLPEGAEPVAGELNAVAQAFATPVDTVVSCLASRSGAPQDAWAIDYQAHLNILEAAQSHGVDQFVLLSAICVQRPKLAFQQAKLKFEAALQSSGLAYTIVRPTAFFKSLSGQVARVREGKPFLVFGDGKLTACKPISDDDLGRYIARCLSDPKAQNAVLPIGGPGPAITPLDQGRALFELTGQAPRFKHVPVAMMKAIVAGLQMGGAVSNRMRAKAELAKIGLYYATESMLVWDAQAQQYDADATPAFGSERLFDYYAQVLSGEVTPDLGDHAVF